MNEWQEVTVRRKQTSRELVAYRGRLLMEVERQESQVTCVRACVRGLGDNRGLSCEAARKSRTVVQHPLSLLSILIQFNPENEGVPASLHHVIRAQLRISVESKEFCIIRRNTN